MKYKDKFIVQNIYNQYSIVSYLMERPENGNIIVETNNEIFHHIFEIKKEQIITLEQVEINLNNSIKECENNIKNIPNLPNYFYMKRIIDLREELKSNERYYKSACKYYDMTSNNIYLEDKELYGKQIHNIKKGIKRLTKRIYKQMQEHPEIDYENLKHYHYNKVYFENKIEENKKTLQSLKNELKQ